MITFHFQQRKLLFYKERGGGGLPTHAHAFSHFPQFLPTNRRFIAIGFWVILRHSVAQNLGVFSAVPRFFLLGFLVFFRRYIIPPFRPSTVPPLHRRSIIPAFRVTGCYNVFRLRLFGYLTLTLCRKPNSRIGIIWLTSGKIQHSRLLFDILIC